MTSIDNVSYLQDIAKFRMFDDTFMSAVFDGQIAETGLLLNIVLERNDIAVISAKSQYYLANLQYREVRLDIYAQDSKNTVYHIEVQRDLKGASVRRARYTAALVDSKLLSKGQMFDEMPERYTVFIVEDDMFGKGFPAYHAQNKITELDNELLEDGGHIVYINGQYRNIDTPIGELMHDFFCVNPDDIIKKEGGRVKMCEIMENRINEEKIELAKEAIKEGDLTLDRIARLFKLPLDIVEELAKKSVIQ